MAAFPPQIWLQICTPPKPEKSRRDSERRRAPGARPAIAARCLFFALAALSSLTMGKKRAGRSANVGPAPFERSGRESNDRRQIIRRRLESKRLENLCEKLEAQARSFVPPKPKKKRKRLEKWLTLRGAAKPPKPITLEGELIVEDRPAAEPGINLLEAYRGAPWEDPYGVNASLLRATVERAMFAHRVAGNTAGAETWYRRALTMDPEDRLGAAGLLTLMLLDDGQAEKAREVVEGALAMAGGAEGGAGEEARAEPDGAEPGGAEGDGDGDDDGGEDDDGGGDGEGATGERPWAHAQTTILHYAKALLEYISFHLLSEPGSSAEVAAEALRQAFRSNLCFARCVVHAAVFLEVVEFAEQLYGLQPLPGTPHEALFLLGTELFPLYLDTPGTVQWIRQVAQDSGADLAPAAMSPEDARLSCAFQEHADEGVDSRDGAAERKAEVDVALFAAQWNTAADLVRKAVERGEPTGVDQDGDEGEEGAPAEDGAVGAKRKGKGKGKGKKKKQRR